MVKEKVKTKFHELVDEKGMKICAVARDLCLNSCHCSRIIRGDVFPTKPLLKRIVEYTEGKITPRILFEDHYRVTQQRLRDLDEATK